VGVFGFWVDLVSLLCVIIKRDWSWWGESEEGGRSGEVQDTGKGMGFGWGG